MGWLRDTFGGGDKPAPTPVSAMETRTAEIATEMWDRYKTSFMPLEKQAISNARGLGSDSTRARYAGRANADLTQSRATPGMGLSDAKGGPGSGASLSSLVRRAGSAGGSTSRAVTAGNILLSDKQRSGLLKAVGVGRGVETAAQGNIAGLAYNQTARIANDERADMADSATQRNAWGGVAGMGLGLYGMKNGWFGGNVDDLPSTPEVRRT